jgi:hypothetical protein
MEPDNIVDGEFFELARDWMSASKLKTCPGHVEKHTYVALWKQLCNYTQRKGFQLLSNCFDAHCITYADVWPESASWRFLNRSNLIGGFTEMQLIRLYAGLQSSVDYLLCENLGLLHYFFGKF